MGYIKDNYEVFYQDKAVGYYWVMSDGSSSYDPAWGSPWDIGAELKKYGLDKKKEQKSPIARFSKIIREENRVSGTRQKIYVDGPVRFERKPQETGESFMIYRRGAKKGEPGYSPLNHDAPHYEGPKTPEGMREWASWYKFNKMDDGTYEAELDEAWWWGGGHNDGGTMHNMIPEKWFGLPYKQFLENVVTLSAAAHYGFTAEALRRKKGLKEFFGFGK